MSIDTSKAPFHGKDFRLNERKTGKEDKVHMDVIFILNN